MCLFSLKWHTWLRWGDGEPSSWVYRSFVFLGHQLAATSKIRARESDRQGNLQRRGEGSRLGGEIKKVKSFGKNKGSPSERTEF